jgi:hypothetical protein
MEAFKITIGHLLKFYFTCKIVLGGVWWQQDL